MDTPVYSVEIKLLALQKSREVLVAETIFKERGMVAVLGRDFLQDYTMVYNGFTGNVTLFSESISDEEIIKSRSDTTVIHDER